MAAGGARGTGAGIREVTLFRDARGWGVTATLASRHQRHWRFESERQARFHAAVLELGPPKLPPGSSASRSRARVVARRASMGTPQDAVVSQGVRMPSPVSERSVPPPVLHVVEGPEPRAPEDRHELPTDHLSLPPPHWPEAPGVVPAELRSGVACAPVPHPWPAVAQGAAAAPVLGPWPEVLETELAAAWPGLQLDGEVRFADGDFI